jgi:large subunit ribosomal protein L3
MGKRSPKRGSVAYWHRVRAKRMVPRVRGWADHGKGLEALVGYKAGMTSVLMADDSESPTKGQEVSRPVTVIEVPPLFVYSISILARTPTGLKTLTEATAANAPKFSSRAITPCKKSDLSKLDKFAQAAADVRVKLISEPQKTGLGKKTPEIFEVRVGGANPKEKLEYAKGILGKELSPSDIFAEGEFVDAVAVTKGKGWQGQVKRFGVALQIRKSSKSRRHGGSVGPERQGKIMFTVPRAGQMGFHRRVDKGKRVIMISSDPAAVLPKDGFPHYGAIKCPYLLVEGSVPGPAKRPVLLRKSVEVKQPRKPAIKEINRDSKQG